MDLNADLGEGFGRWTLGDDARIVGHITSANLACGFHAGDFRVMEATVDTPGPSSLRSGGVVGAVGGGVVGWGVVSVTDRS